MADVLTRQVPQEDILIHRGADEDFYVNWKEDHRDGKGYQNKDLRAWNAKFFLCSNDKQVYEKQMTTTATGYAIVNIPASAFTTSDWDLKEHGEWRIMGYGPNGESELLAWGNYEMKW